jgi:DNA-directed RNA polymerase specialized sigma24 family protein
MTPWSATALPESLPVLIERIAAGDRDALRTLYACLSGTVCGEVERVLSDPHEVRAVVYSTFVEVWWLARFHTRKDADIPAWISVVAGQRATEQQRTNALLDSAAELRRYGEDRNRVILAGLLGQAPPTGPLIP